MDTRDAITNMIDKIHDEDILKGYLALVQKLSAPDQYALWTTLTSEEKDELIIVFEETYKEEKHISNAYLRTKYARWLDK